MKVWREKKPSLARACVKKKKKKKKKEEETLKRNRLFYENNDSITAAYLTFQDLILSCMVNWSWVQWSCILVSGDLTAVLLIVT